MEIDEKRQIVIRRMVRTYVLGEIVLAKKGLYPQNTLEDSLTEANLNVFEVEYGLGCYQEIMSNEQTS